MPKLKGEVLLLYPIQKLLFEILLLFYYSIVHNSISIVQITVTQVPI